MSSEFYIATRTCINSTWLSENCQKMKSNLILYAIAFSTVSLVVVESTMFSGQEQQDIVDYINLIRRSVSPTAADMREI